MLQLLLQFMHARKGHARESLLDFRASWQITCTCFSATCSSPARKQTTCREHNRAEHTSALCAKPCQWMRSLFDETFARGLVQRGQICCQTTCLIERGFRQELNFLDKWKFSHDFKMTKAHCLCAFNAIRALYTPNNLVRLHFCLEEACIPCILIIEGCHSATLSSNVLALLQESCERQNGFCHGNDSPEDEEAVAMLAAAPGGRP